MFILIGESDDDEGKMTCSRCALAILLSLFSLIPNAAANSGPLKLCINEFLPTKNCGWFLLADVLKPKNSNGPFDEAIWQKGKYLGTQKTSPSRTLAFIAKVPFGYTIWILPVPFNTTPYSIALGLT